METKENGTSNGTLDGPTNPMVTPLLNDLYQFTMAYAYWKAGKHQERSVSVFLFVSLILKIIFLYFPLLLVIICCRETSTEAENICFFVLFNF